MTAEICISATGLFTPEHSISNDELVASYNAWASRENERNAQAIAAGQATALPMSNSEFIVKASGIESRKVLDKQGILDIDRMRPSFAPRSEDAPSILAEMGATAARQALESAGLAGSDIDCVIVACSNLQRPYPAIAVEIQQLIGARGFAFDMNVACASAVFGIQTAADQLRAGSCQRALVISPEICSGHLNFRNRDCHFIFGDAATAVILERRGERPLAQGFSILSTRLMTQFSNNIRNDFGFLNPCELPARRWDEIVFRQEGRKVFKEVVPMVSELIGSELEKLSIAATDIKRFWLHQANLSMNEFIVRRLLGRDASREEAPVILDRYANTSSAGSVIAMHLHQDGIAAGDTAVLCAFGAGYSAGCAVLRRF